MRAETINPLLNPQGDRCTACGHPFVRSFVNFEHLPLVRFSPSRDVNFVECLRLLRQPPPPRKTVRTKEPQNPWANEGPDVQTLSLAGDAEAAENAAMDFDDPFTKTLLDFEPTGRFAPPVATHEMLLHMEAADVYVVQWGTHARSVEFYRNMMPDVPIVLCHSCNHFFHEEDWEFATMSKGACPFCKANVKGVDAGSAATQPRGNPAAATSNNAYMRGAMALH